MNQRTGLFLVITLVLAIGLILSARTISEYFVGIFWSPDSNPRYPSVLATVETTNSKASIKRHGKKKFSALKKGEIIYHLDQLQTELGEDVRLLFTSGWKISLSPNTSLVVESYRPAKKEAPLLLHLLSGQINVNQRGPLGMLYVSQNNRIFSPTVKADESPRQVVLVPSQISSANQSLNQSPSDKSTDHTAVRTEDSAVRTEDSAVRVDGHFVSAMNSPTTASSDRSITPQKVKRDGEETLSSPYIESVLNEQASDFKRCQMNMIRDQKISEGFLLVSMTIQPNGRLQDIKVLQNTSNNENLAECTQSVLERVRFRNFAGTPITLTYPLQFK